jgi:hypothetical protein
VGGICGLLYIQKPVDFIFLNNEIGQCRVANKGSSVKCYPESYVVCWCNVLLISPSSCPFSMYSQVGLLLFPILFVDSKQETHKFHFYVIV